MCAAYVLHPVDSIPKGPVSGIPGNGCHSTVAMVACPQGGVIFGLLPFCMADFTCW